MAEAPPAEKKTHVSRLKKITNAIKRSPKILRKAMGGKKRMNIGKSDAHSDLEGCKENGWLFRDEDIRAGVNYKVKYLGSVEVDFDASSSSNNQEHAQKAMRALRAYCKGQPQAVPKLMLTVSVGSISLKSLDGTKMIMRHSTTRIAYSTVDSENPKLFGYVGMVKDTNLTLCHIFKCKNAKQGYEMTLVCAQAFDLNYRSFSVDKSAAVAASRASEEGDIEPTKAWQKKGDASAAGGGAAAGSAAADGATVAPAAGGGADGGAGSGADGGATAPTEGSGDADVSLPTTKARRTSLVPAEAAAGVEVEREPVFLAIMNGQDPADLAAKYFGSLGVNMIEDDADDAAPQPAAGAGSLAPNVLEVGVDAADYNKARRESLSGDAAGDDGGYMTVGADASFAEDEEDWE